MVKGKAAGTAVTRAFRMAAMLSASVVATGCASISDMDPTALLSGKPAETETEVDGSAQGAQSELQKATEYWGKEYAGKPTDLETSLNYARNLKALGQKQQALGVLQQASMFHANDRKLNSEYGRLALEMDQVQLAKKLLEAADDPVKPDWRVLSARGTAMAKEGRYSEAIPYYERALQISPNQTSVLNNLALAYAMKGEAARAEEVLRQITEQGGANAKVRQNLALVLGLQGKYDEATKVGAESGSSVAAAENTDIIKKMVRLDPKPYVPAGTGAGVWETTIVGAAPSTVAPSNRAPLPWQTNIAAAGPDASAPAASAAVAAGAPGAGAAPAPAAAVAKPGDAPGLHPAAR